MLIENRIYHRIDDGAGPKIVVIGGGTGLSVILRGIKKITQNLTAIVNVSDDGGGSGVLREDLGMLPPGDIRSCILAMADEEGIMQELLQYRFKEGMLAGQNFGNLLIAALNGICGNFEDAVTKTHEILRVRGKVIPVTAVDVDLCAELKNGNVVVGESQIPSVVLRESSPIEKVFLKPDKPVATKEAIDAILKADIIIIGPGSLYTSMIANFLVDGISEAVAGAGGKRLLICNVMTQPGETDNYTVTDHVRAVNRYLGRDAVEYVLANNKVIGEAELDRYAEDGSVQVIPKKQDRAFMDEMGISLLENNFVEIKKGYIRHDAERIANAVIGLMNE